MNTIISHCRISNQNISANEKIFLARQGKTLDAFTDEIYSKLKPDYPKFHKMDRQSKLGFLASEMVMKDLNKKYSSRSMAIVLSNSNASLDTDLKYWESAQTHASPSLFVYTLPNIVCGEICIRHQIKGENTFFVLEKFDAEWLASYVNLILDTGKAECCLGGWIDVMGNQGDVFLYLAGKSKTGVHHHTASKLLELYHHG